MAAWNEAPAAGGLGECAALVRSAEALRSSAPELAVQLARRALAVGAEEAKTADLAQTKSLSMRAQAMLASGLVRISRYAEAVDPAFAALALAEGEGVTDVATALRLDLAACTPEIGEPLLGCALLQPVLETARSSASVRAVALGRLVGCVAHVGRRDDIEDALAEADRLLAADDALSPDLRRLERARLSVRAAAYHRWYGDTEDAADAAREGLTQLNRLRGLRPEMAQLRARLVLELACALLDDGALDEAASVAESVLAEPVRATSAASVGRLMLAVSTRVYLPSGRVDRGRGLLDQAVWVAGRHGLDGLLADVLTTVSQLDEAAERPVEALESLRIARAAEKRRLRGISLATRRLLTEASPATWDAKAVNVLLRSVLRAAGAQPATRDWHLAAQRVTQPLNRSASSVQTGQWGEGDRGQRAQRDQSVGRPAFSAAELVAPTMNQSAAEQLAAEQLAAKQSTAEQSAAEQPAAEQTVAGQQTAGQPAAGQAAAEQPTAGQPLAGQAATGQTTASQPLAGQTTVGQPAAGQTASGQTTVGQTTSGQPVAVQPGVAQQGDDLAVAYSAARSGDADRSIEEAAARSSEALAAWSSESNRPAGELVSAVVDRMHDQAETDAATGLLNKDGLIRRLRAVRNGDRPVALTLVRLDGYPSSGRFAGPETHPDAAADFELSELAGRVRDIAPDNAELARSDGSELAVLLPHTTRDQAEKFAAEIESAWLGTASGHGISTGVVQSNPDAPTVDARALINAARHALTPAVAAPSRPLPPSTVDEPESPGDPGDTLRVGRSIISSLSIPTGSGGKRRAADDPDPHEEPPANHPDQPATADTPPARRPDEPAATITASGTLGTTDTVPATPDTSLGPPDSAPGAPSTEPQPTATITASGTLGTSDTESGTSDLAPGSPGAAPESGERRSSSYEQTKAELARLMSALTDGKGELPPEESRERTPLPAPSRPTEDNLSNGTARPSQSIPTPPAPDEIPEPERRPDIPDPGEPDPIPPDPGPEPPDEPTLPSFPTGGTNEPSRGPRNLAAAFGTTSQITAETFAEVRAGSYIQTYADPPTGATADGSADPRDEPPPDDTGDPSRDRLPGDTADRRSADDTAGPRAERSPDDFGGSSVERSAGDAADARVERLADDAGGSGVERSADDFGGSRVGRSAGDAGDSRAEPLAGDSAGYRAEAPADDSTGAGVEPLGGGTAGAPVDDTAVTGSSVGSEPRAGKVEIVGGAEVVPIAGTNRRPSMAAVFGGQSDEIAHADDSGAEPERAGDAEPGRTADTGPGRAAGGKRESRAERSSGSTTIAGLLAEALAAYQETDEHTEPAPEPRPAARESRLDSRRDSGRDSRRDSGPDDFDRLFDWSNQSSASGRHRSPE